MNDVAVGGENDRRDRQTSGPVWAVRRMVGQEEAAVTQGTAWRDGRCAEAARKSRTAGAGHSLRRRWAGWRRRVVGGPVEWEKHDQRAARSGGM